MDTSRFCFPKPRSVCGGAIRTRTRVFNMFFYVQWIGEKFCLQRRAGNKHFEIFAQRLNRLLSKPLSTREYRDSYLEKDGRVIKVFSKSAFSRVSYSYGCFFQRSNEILLCWWSSRATSSYFSTDITRGTTYECVLKCKLTVFILTRRTKTVTSVKIIDVFVWKKKNF